MGDPIHKNVTMHTLGEPRTLPDALAELRRVYDARPDDFFHAVRPAGGEPLLTLNVMGILVTDPEGIVRLVQYPDGTLGQRGAGMPQLAAVVGQWELVRFEFCAHSLS